MIKATELVSFNEDTMKNILLDIEQEIKSCKTNYIVYDIPQEVYVDKVVTVLIDHGFNINHLRSAYSAIKGRFSISW